jgi:hypothetical protein
MVAFVAAGLLFPTLEERRFTVGILLTCAAVTGGLLVSLTVREPARRGAPTREHASLGLIAQGLTLLRTDSRLRRLVLLSLATNSFELFLFGLIQPQFRQSGLPGFLFGPAFGLASLLALLGTRYAYLVDRLLHPRRALLVATALPGAIYLALAVATQPAVAVALFCLQSGTTAVKGPLLAAYTNARLPDRGRATTLSVVSLFGSLYVGAMGLVIGWVADISVRGAFAMVGALVLAGALLLRVDDLG